MVRRLEQHYEDLRDVDITTSVAATQWARTAEIGAAALVIREPLYVLDVLPDGTIFVQQHRYRAAGSVDGAIAETRWQRSITVSTFMDFMQSCWRANVIPILLLDRRGVTEQHFQATRFSELMYERCINSETALTRPCMRERLDSLHAALGMPQVSATLGTSLSPARRSKGPQTLRPATAVCDQVEPVDQTFRADMQAYDRVLALGGNIDSGSIADRKKHRLYVESNAAAIKTWATSSPPGHTSTWLRCSTHWKCSSSYHTQPSQLRPLAFNSYAAGGTGSRIMRSAVCYAVSETTTVWQAKRATWPGLGSRQSKVWRTRTSSSRCSTTQPVGNDYDLVARSSRRTTSRGACHGWSGS